MKLFKKNENKKTTKLPMTGKVKKGFRYYCINVMVQIVEKYGKTVLQELDCAA